MATATSVIIPGLRDVSSVAETREERPAAIPEDRRGEAKQDVQVAGESDAFSQAHQVLKQRREHENRQGQDQ